MQSISRGLRQLPVNIRLIVAGFLMIVLLMPLHGFISTWLGTLIGPLYIWKAWKEILFVLVGFLVIFQIIKDSDLRRWLFSSVLNKVILVYTLWQLFTAIFANPGSSALVMGLAINLRIVLFFMVAQILVYYWPGLKELIPKVILWPLVIVVMFGLLQMTVLPKSFLVNFGYNKDLTIAPYNTIDSQPDTLRIQSTLRGPNPLGAYLILPILMLVSWLWYHLSQKKLKSGGLITPLGLLLPISLVVLYGSHSRSAWIAMIIALAVWLFLMTPKKWKLLLAAAGSGVLLLGVLLVLAFRNTHFIQDIIFHDRANQGPVATSNSVREEAFKQGLDDFAARPLLGCSPGCAGPASFHSNSPRLSENYYLQLGQESGIIGLGLFVAVVIILGFYLYKTRQDPEAKILLASLIGLSIANLFLHVWADDTLAYIWWGYAGVWFGLQRTEEAKLVTSIVHSDKPRSPRRASRPSGRNQPKS